MTDETPEFPPPPPRYRRADAVDGSLGYNSPGRERRDFEPPPVLNGPDEGAREGALGGGRPLGRRDGRAYVPPGGQALPPEFDRDGVPLDPDAPPPLRPRPAPVPGKTGLRGVPGVDLDARKRIQEEQVMRALAGYLAAGVTHHDVLAANLHVSRFTVNRLIKRLKLRWQQQSDSLIVEMRHKQQVRLDTVFAALWVRVQEGDVRAIQQFLEACKREAALWGLDMPIKIAPTTPGGSLLDLASVLGVSLAPTPESKRALAASDPGDEHAALPAARPTTGLGELLATGAPPIEATWEVIPDPPSLGRGPVDDRDDWERHAFDPDSPSP